MKMEKKSTELTPDGKRTERFKRWLSPPNVKFSGPAAEEGYKKRVTRFMKVMNLEEPDRVPVILPAGTFPLYYAGMTLKEASTTPLGVVILPYADTTWLPVMLAGIAKVVFQPPIALAFRLLTSAVPS